MVVNWKVVAGTLGALLAFVGISLLLPMGVGLYYGEPSWWSFGVAAALAMGLGGGTWYGLRKRDADADLGIREAFAVVALTWLVLSLVGSLPFVLGGVLDSYTDAFFETMSGFTTTGATILGGADTPAIESIPRGFLFWRSLAHWLGGMGIIVLTLAILPILGVGGMQLFRAEVSGPSADKLTPRVRETAKRLWLVYVGFTVVQIILLTPAMSLFEAINHAFATMATGGFSTRNGSVADYDSAYVDGIITLFMFLGGVNFALHLRMLRGEAITVFRDTELRVYVGLVALATLLILIGTYRPTLEAAGWSSPDFEGYATLPEALRYAIFQALAIMTTTGFGTADYEVWPPLAMGVVFLLFFSGAMAGSTSGGVKLIRHVLLAKNSYREIKQLIHPRALIPIRLNGSVVSQEVMRNVLSFIILYLGL
ncbi:MAG: TrkH family potassium uptake protein, partial [Bacteroidota bacterium]